LDAWGSLCCGRDPVRRLRSYQQAARARQKRIAAEQRREQIAQMRNYFAELHRVDTVAFRIRVANRAFCRERVSGQIGVFAATPESLPRRFRSFAGEAMNLTWAQSDRRLAGGGLAGGASRHPRS
jgi:hypothetical protein